MLYFIPAWYKQNNWCENEQTWHVRRMQTEFDDTVKQVQLFQRSGTYPYQIMLLSFSPNFRHFLHRQGVYHAPYWSCFDSIQEIHRKKVRLLSIHSLKWPDGIEYIYTPFVMIAMLNGEKYAQVEYGEDGNPIQIDMYKNGKLIRKNIYDDRGFVSSTIEYKDSIPMYQDYLMENGNRKLRVFMEDGHVLINPDYPDYYIQNNGKEITKQFSRQTYESLELVIYEVVSSFLGLTGENDIFCAAMHEIHTRLLLNALYNRKMILSFFGSRYKFNGQAEEAELIGNADYIITDSVENTELVRNNHNRELNNIVDITPFDTRMDTGISQQLNVQKILVPVDGMQDDSFDDIVAELGRYLNTNNNARVCLFTRKADYNKKSLLLEKTRKALIKAGFNEKWADEKENSGQFENNVDNQSKVKIRFMVEQCVEELAVSKCMKEQRVLLDLRKIPELYLQIMAVSIGIPQIVHEENKFAIDGGNCVVIKHLSQLMSALEFYLNGFTNWNDAQVYSYELGKKYTTGVLLDKWKEVIDSIE